MNHIAKTACGAFWLMAATSGCAVFNGGDDDDDGWTAENKTAYEQCLENNMAAATAWEMIEASCRKQVAGPAPEADPLTLAVTGDFADREAASALRGYAYARRNCAGCHAVSTDKTQSPNPLAPTFEELANRPDMSRMTLAALLRSSHTTMPNYMLSDETVDDLAAHMLTMSAAN